MLTLVCPPGSCCCCLDGCEELGVFGVVTCILGCLIVCGCDIFCSISLSNLQATYHRNQLQFRPSLSSTLLAQHSSECGVLLSLLSRIDCTLRPSSSSSLLVLPSRPQICYTILDVRVAHLLALSPRCRLSQLAELFT